MTFNPENLENTSSKMEKEKETFTVAIFGTSSESTEAEKNATKDTREIAEMLIKDGFDIATGGYGGVMKAAIESGQKTMTDLKIQGTIKSYPIESDGLRKFETTGTTVLRSTGLPERLTHLISESDAYIVLNGGLGTIVELLASIESTRIDRTVNEIDNKHHTIKPILIIDPTLKHSDLLSSLVKQEKKLQNPETLDHIYFIGQANNKTETIEKVLNLYKENYETENEILARQEAEGLKKYTFKNFTFNQQNFIDGAGI